MRLRALIAAELQQLADLLAWRLASPRVCLVASAQVARADTSPRLLYRIPSGHEAHLLVIHGDVGSDAGAAASLDVGRIGAPQLFVSGHDVLAANGIGQRFPLTRKLGQVSGQEIDVTARYAESGGPSTTGGPWTVTVLYSKAGN